MTRLLALSTIVLTVLASSCASAATHASSSRCTGGQLSATFKVVPGSAGAGNIVYALRVTNTSKTTCTLKGLPAGRLLGKTGNPLPTKVIVGVKGTILVHLAPGKSTSATARFSPDVPGPGETGRQCEPVSYWFRISAPGGGTRKAKITPPTSVCEHGQLQFTAYGAARA